MVDLEAGEQPAPPDRVMASGPQTGGARVASGIVQPGPPLQHVIDIAPGDTAEASGIVAQRHLPRRPGGADHAAARPATHDDASLRAPSTTIPFELFGTKITVKTTGGGANVSIKQDDLGKFLAREYLGPLVPASQLTELINSYLNIKFRCSTSLGYNYKKPKREGLGGLARDVLNNIAGDAQDAALGDQPGRFEVWNTLDDLLGSASQQGKTKPIRSVTLKTAGTLSMTPNTPWVPFSGALKVAYSAVYEEYLDRIEIHLADIAIAGRLNYRVDAALPFGGPGSTSDPNDARSTPQAALATHDNANMEIRGSSKIKPLAFNEMLPAATFLYDRRTGAYGFRGIDAQQFRKLAMMTILMFLNFTSMSSDLAG